jgi:gamma-glutamyl:cysteine ligase YbdK (ATP-grasp superfamily)
LDGSVLPARRAIEELLRLLGPTMEALGDHRQLIELVGTLLERGSGADRQRSVFDVRHNMVDVIDALTLTHEGGASLP